MKTNISEVDVRISTAKNYPRDTAKLLDEALSLATRTRETAERCFYTLERGKNPICGPSVRLAEIAIYCWGNVEGGARIIGKEDGFIIAEGICWDLEKNLRISKQVKRKIYSSNMEDLVSNAAMSIAFRNAVFSVIPRAFIDSIFEECKRIAVGDADNFVERRDKAFKWLNDSGISTAQALSFFNRQSLEQFDKEDLASLIGVHNAVRDRLCTLEQMFDLSEKVSDVSVEEKIRMLTSRGE